jgi:hypothetical protein
VLICSDWLIAGGWFVLREKYCWLVVDKPNEHGISVQGEAWMLGKPLFSRSLQLL